MTLLCFFFFERISLVDFEHQWITWGWNQSWICRISRIRCEPQLPLLLLHTIVEQFSRGTDNHEWELMREWEWGWLALPVSCGGGTGRGSTAHEGWWTSDRWDPLSGGVQWLNLTRHIPVQTGNQSWCCYFMWNTRRLREFGPSKQLVWGVHADDTKDVWRELWWWLQVQLLLLLPNHWPQTSTDKPLWVLVLELWSWTKQQASELPSN